MSDMMIVVDDVEDEERNENLVRDYLLYQLQLNLLHAQWDDKSHDEAVEELMEAKRTMQEMEDDVVKKFVALNKQYEHINGIIDSDEARELHDYQKMLEEIELLSIKRKTTLDKFNGDAEAYLANRQALTEQMAQLKEEIENQQEMIAALNAHISKIDSKLLSP
ncbi:unnamed protein product [Cercopithifilaria johnstoni]|uniref:Uncharacterized protein n=1 Tax=Cercopithifilaria johnstoni TaxID=2874296 RepID=A0A8J2M3P5_9BILA|nr:unnamed protein product [Cercopithifilaria johnstoni]